MNPRAWDTLLVDPFSARDLLDLAAAIHPWAWTAGPGPRGLARLLGEGRVPDEIRLRTRRGGQSWDEWFLISDQRDCYLDEVAALRTTPGLAGWIDADALHRTVAAWPWGQHQGTAGAERKGVQRLLSLALFARLTHERLAATRQ